MIPSTRRHLAAAGLCLALAVAGGRAARAEVGLVLPPVEHDAIRGVRIGEFVFTPIIGLEGRYNSNVFRQDSREGTASAGVLTVRPGFRFTNPNPSWLSLSWDAMLGVAQYFSSNSAAKSQGRLSAKTTLDAHFLPKGVFGVFVSDTFIRELQPRNYSTNLTYDRNFNRVEGGIEVRPGGGALQMMASYAYNFDLFDSFKDGDIAYHEARFLTTWDFFPKTTFLFDANWRKVDWKKEVAGYRTNSMPLRIQAGVKGYITKKVALLVKAGFGKGFFSTGTDYQNFIGEVSAGFKPTPFTVIDVGYARDFSESFYANWYVGDSVHLKVSQQLVQRLNLEAGAKYTYLSYASFTPTTATATTSSRRDHAVSATADISFSIIRYLAVKVGYRFDGLFTPFRLDVAQASGTWSDYGGFLAHQVFAELSLIY